MARDSFRRLAWVDMTDWNIWIVKFVRKRSFTEGVCDIIFSAFSVNIAGYVPIVRKDICTKVIQSFIVTFTTAINVAGYVPIVR